MQYFTLAEAERLLPEIEKHLRSALFHKSESEAAEHQMDLTLQRVQVSGGARIHPGQQLELRARRDSNIKALRSALEAIEHTGALVKDLDIGLLDFMTRYHSRDVCLCWKLGEDAIRFWHGTEEGFRGRKPIDQEFLDNHNKAS